MMLYILISTALLSSAAVAQYGGYGGSSYSSSPSGSMQQGNPNSNNTDNNGLTGTVVAGNGNNSAICAPVPRIFNLTGEDLYKSLVIYSNTFLTAVHNISQTNGASVNSNPGPYLQKIIAIDNALFTTNGKLQTSVNAPVDQCVASGKAVMNSLDDVISHFNDSIAGNCSTLTGDDYYHHIYQQMGASIKAVRQAGDNGSISSDPNPSPSLQLILNHAKIVQLYTSTITSATVTQAACNDVSSQFIADLQGFINLGDQLSTDPAARKKEFILRSRV